MITGSAALLGTLFFSALVIVALVSIAYTNKQRDEDELALASEWRHTCDELRQQLMDSEKAHAQTKEEMSTMKIDVCDHIKQILEIIECKPVEPV